MGQVRLQLAGEGGIFGVGGLHHSQVGGGFHNVHGGPLRPRVWAVADTLIMAADCVWWTMRLLRER